MKPQAGASEHCLRMLWRRIGCADVVNFNAHCVKIECETLTQVECV